MKEENITNKDLLKAINSIAVSQKNLENTVTGLVKGQINLEAGQKKLEAGQKKLEAGQKKLEAGQKKLEAGQNKLKITVDELVMTTKLQLDEMGERFDRMDERFDRMDERFDRMDGRVTKLEALMVTKDYLDDKLGELKGDIIEVIRKEDTKLKTLTKILHVKKVIDTEEKNKVFLLEPFPDLRLSLNKN